ncbi:MAG: electron transfer flavoprotein subunit beta/FixA family protein [Bacteriovoracaceae bacterium]|nr:electron transfer flavoprotein subunit beta/FixA family protein [Bacteriovoracaceae bacterium]
MSGLNIIVTVKQVPDTHNISGDAMKEDGTVNRAVLPAIMNPEDLNALEEALKIKDLLGGKITVITMGPPKAVQVLKECLFRGADDVILISDRRFAGADTLATSYALKCAIEKIGGYQLIFCGRQAIDGDTAQVGPQIAEKLGINQLSGIMSVKNVDTSSITVCRQTEYGQQIVRSNFPVLITVTGDANEPRFPSVKKVMAYKDTGRLENEESYDEAYIESENKKIASIKEWNVDDIGADVARCGLGGSPTKVKHIEKVVLTTSGINHIQGSDAGISELIAELKNEHIIG